MRTYGNTHDDIDLFHKIDITAAAAAVAVALSRGRGRGRTEPCTWPQPQTWRQP